MLYFREFYNLKKTLKSIKMKSLGIPRRYMPQIKTKDLKDFKSYLKRKNINFKILDINPTDYKASQKEFNDKKILRLYSNNKNIISDKPIIVSNDGYIIDGHHRWISNYIKLKNKNNKKILMSAIKIDMKAKNLIDIMKNYSRSFSKKVSENKNVKHKNECYARGNSNS